MQNSGNVKILTLLAIVIVHFLSPTLQIKNRKLRYVFFILMATHPKFVTGPVLAQ